MKFTHFFFSIFVSLCFSVKANDINLVWEETWGDAYYQEVISDGNTLYVASDGVILLDVSMPSEPKEITKFRLNGNETIQNLSKLGNYLYAHSAGQVYIIDVTDIENPEVITSISKENKIHWRSFAVNKERLFLVGNDWSGDSNNTYLYVYDVSNKTSPVELIRHTLAETSLNNVGLTLTNNALVALADDEVRLLSLDQARYLETVFSEKTLGLPSGSLFTKADTLVKGDIVYYPTMDRKILVYDFADPSDVKKNEIQVDDHIYALTLNGDELYATYGDREIERFDISTPFSPIAKDGSNIRISDYGTVVATTDDYFALYNLNSIVMLSEYGEIGRYSFANFIYEVSAVDDHLAAFGYYSQMLSTSDNAISRVSNVRHTDRQCRVAYKGFIYTCTNDIWLLTEQKGLSFFGVMPGQNNGVSDEILAEDDELTLAAPQAVVNYSIQLDGELSLKEEFAPVDYVGDFAYVTAIGKKGSQYFLGTDKGLFHFYNNDENELIATNLIGDENWIDSVKIRGDYLYSVVNGELSIWNVMDPEKPELQSVTRYSGGNTWDFEVFENWVFLPTSGNGISILDISNPKEPLALENENVLASTLLGAEIIDNKMYVHSNMQVHRFAINKAPRVLTESIGATEDTDVVISLSVENLENDVLTYNVVNEPVGGLVTVENSGELTYRPNRDFNGTDAFSIQVTDQYDGSTQKLISVEVTPVNDGPVVQNNEFSVIEGNTLKSTLIATDIENDELTFSLGTNASSGNVVLNNDGSFEYTPNASFKGDDSFSFTVTDASGEAVKGVAIVNVAAKANLSQTNSSQTSGSSSGGGGSFSYLGLFLLLGCWVRRTSKVQVAT